MKEKILKALEAIEGTGDVISMIKGEYDRFEPIEIKAGKMETEITGLKTTVGDLEKELSDANEKAGQADDLSGKNTSLEGLVGELRKEVKAMREKSDADDAEKKRLSDEKVARETVDKVKLEVKGFFGDNLQDAIDLALTRKQLVIDEDGGYKFSGKTGNEAIEQFKKDYSHKQGASTGTGSQGGQYDPSPSKASLQDRLNKGFGQG